MDVYDPIEGGQDRSSKFFLTLVVISQIFGIACVILTGIWLGGFWGGFNWTETVFNYHPLFMVLGLVFLYGDAILVYRVLRFYRKLQVKVLHAVLHILAFLFSVIGVKAVFEMHDRARIPNMYSLHSWLGIIALILFGLQWLVGLIFFFVPRVPKQNRASYLPVHVSFGLLLYLLIIGVCISGITEKNIFASTYSTAFAERYFMPSKMVGNALGVCIVIFGALVFFIVSFPAYRRVEVVSPERRALND